MGRSERIKQENMRRWIYISCVVLALAILGFVTVFYLYNRNLERYANESLKEFAVHEELVEHDEIEEVSMSEDKGVEEVILNNTNNVIENNKLTIKKVNKNEEDVSKEKEIVENKAQNEIKNEKVQEVSTNENSNQNGVTEQVSNVEGIENVIQEVNVEEKKELEFEVPVSGEILKDYAKDTLVYSKTLDEWIVHLGVDIKANKTSVVKSAESGIIEKINYDPRYGDSITIEHGNGFKTVYSNLLVTDFFKVGEKVEKGDTIGTVGDSASFEISDDSHLHFEMYKDGENVNPTLYLK